jgi:hypothetical protein
VELLLLRGNERQAARPVGIYMQHNTNSVIARTINEKMPSAVVTFLLSAVLLTLCEYGPRIKIGYNLLLRVADVLCICCIHCY